MIGVSFGVSSLGEDITATILADSALFSYEEVTEILEMMTEEFHVLASHLKASSSSSNTNNDVKEPRNCVPLS
jgi:hypothetical protein